MSLLKKLEIKLNLNIGTWMQIQSPVVAKNLSLSSAEC